MKIKLLIATGDSDYAEHLSNVLSEKHSDTFEVSVCSTAKALADLLAVKNFDTALIEPSFFANISLNQVRLPLLLWDESNQEMLGDSEKIRKYQRVSSITGNILEKFSEISAGSGGFGSENAHITAVWSPAGGVGKTTVALACATRNASDGKQALYLDLDCFSSVPVYFTETGKSISTVFEKLESPESGIEMLIRGIRQKDSETGVSYLTHPDNYDDMNILSAHDIGVLISACSKVTDELIIDLPCVCDERTWQVFEYADRMLLVFDPSKASHVKLRQFIVQHNIFERVKPKVIFVANKGASPDEQPSVSLPLVRSSDESAVYKTLSAHSFEI